MKIIEIAIAEIAALNLKVKADSFNPHFKSVFASYEAVMAILQPELTKRNLSVFHPPHQDELHMVVMNKEGEHVRYQIKLPADWSNPQKVGGSYTYMRRYSVITTFNIIVEDDDGNTGAGKSDKPDYFSEPEPPKYSAALKGKVEKAKNRQELTKLYKDNPTMHTNGEFLADLANRQQSILESDARKENAARIAKEAAKNKK